MERSLSEEVVTTENPKIHPSLRKRLNQVAPEVVFKISMHLNLPVVEERDRIEGNKLAEEYLARRKQLISTFHATVSKKYGNTTFVANYIVGAVTANAKKSTILELATFAMVKSVFALE
jgi:hypothetical protein